jgi:hypothetical protein
LHNLVREGLPTIHSEQANSHRASRCGAQREAKNQSASFALLLTTVIAASTM